MADLELREAVLKAVVGSSILEDVSVDGNFEGTVTYNKDSVWVDPAAPGFTNYTSKITDEEVVRIYLLHILCDRYEYSSDKNILEVERHYAPVGRPIGKGGRIDVLVRHAGDSGAEKNNSFMFIECKSPSKYDEDLKYLNGQLFLLSLQEQPRPKYLVYYTVECVRGKLRDRILLIDTNLFGSYDEWNAAGQPIVDALPVNYDKPPETRYANIENDRDELKTLSRSVSKENLNRIRNEIHDVIWGGGGTNNNEVFVYVTKLLLCKIYDEKETTPGEVYQFQRFGGAENPESPDLLASRINDLYKTAESEYLALPAKSEGPAFDSTRISTVKIAYVVGRLEGISVTQNDYEEDLLGDFFEQIVAHDFTQSKGQFFTPHQVVNFMVELIDLKNLCRETVKNKRDSLGRPKLPFIIDPSAGSGTFLISAMRCITDSMLDDEFSSKLPARVMEYYDTWFSKNNQNLWAREFIYGVEYNHDLGLACKVNMVLHGDGSMNTFINNGLYPFSAYHIEGRANVLSVNRVTESSAYNGTVNEEFDVIISNPPFSLTMSDDEKTIVEDAFTAMGASISEKIFIERWYQLLREGGIFCCVLPETILDTSSNWTTRLFLLINFEILSIVSLPYDAFKPFTATKTSIIYARKRSTKLAESIQSEYDSLLSSGCTAEEALLGAYSKSGLSNQKIFMAEPEQLGYKRRKGLPDLPKRNDLYFDSSSASEEETVLFKFCQEDYSVNDKRLGFWVDVVNVCSRKGMRLDPKYRWLWDHQNGVVIGNSDRYFRVGDFIAPVALEKISKGSLEQETKLIDLEQVEARQAILSDSIPLVTEVGSQKVSFSGADFVFSKLEPYLAKFIINPDPKAIGSTEWLGFKFDEGVSKIAFVYLLMLPEMCEAYRRIQSGKRHARLSVSDFLDLRLAVDSVESLEQIEEMIISARSDVVNLRNQVRKVRDDVDTDIVKFLLSGNILN